MASRKKRKPLSARELANLSPHPQFLRRGAKPKDLTITQMDYCAHRARGVGVTQTCLELGLTPWTGSNWERQNVLVQQLIDEYKKRLKDHRFEAINEQVELRTEFLDRQSICRLQRAKKTDMAIVKLIHTGYQRTGAIKPSSISASASATAASAALAGGTMAEIYKSRWLRDKEASMAAQLEAEYADKQFTTNE